LSKGVYLHPGKVRPATIIWRSPVNGTISVSATARRCIADKRNPPKEKNDGVFVELRHQGRTLAKMHAPENAKSVNMAVARLSVKKGDLLRLVIAAGKSAWFDTTRVNVTIRDNDGKTWDLTEALTDKGRFANALPPGAVDAVWWACSGDDTTINTQRLEKIKRPVYSSSNRKVQFEGTSARVSIRGRQMILSLGAPGKITAFGKTFASEKPESTEHALR
jgi:hypothetical protein